MLLILAMLILAELNVKRMFHLWLEGGMRQNDTRIL